MAEPLRTCNQSHPTDFTEKLAAGDAIAEVTANRGINSTPALADLLHKAGAGAE